MEPIKINVNVQIGVTEELYGLLSLLTKHTPAPAVAAAQSENKPAETPAVAAAGVINKEPTPEPKKEEATAPEPAAEAAPEPEAPAQEIKEYTEVDVRAAMERTRKRIEGEDYKENTSSEKYKKYHRALTAEFKNLAAFLGSDKPSALPSSELRETFCNQCDALILEDGKITRKLPF